MNILITNSALREFGGTQTVVTSLCHQLRKRGHQVMIFSSHLGHVAELLVEQKFPVVSHLRDLPFPPDIIHGQHHLETMSALLALPETPAIYYIHGIMPWEERVPIHPRILGYVNLGEIGAFRVAVEKSIPPTRLHVMENSIDFDAIPAPKKPPASLRTAAYCPRTPATPETLETLRLLCAQHSIEFYHEPGWAQGTVADPYTIYREHDLVFGTGRTALEALATGCVVALADHARIGPLLTATNLVERRSLNFCLPVSEPPVSEKELASQIAAYSPEAQQKAVDFIWENADSGVAVDRLLEFYEKIIHEWKTTPRPTVADELHAASNYLRALAPLVGEAEKVARLEQANRRLDMRLGILKRRFVRQKHKLAELRMLHQKLRNKISDLLKNHENAPLLQQMFAKKWMRRLEKLLRAPK